MSKSNQKNNTMQIFGNYGLKCAIQWKFSDLRRCQEMKHIEYYNTDCAPKNNRNSKPTKNISPITPHQQQSCDSKSEGTSAIEFEIIDDTHPIAVGDCKRGIHEAVVVLDLETTGLSPVYDEIKELVLEK